MIKLFTSCMKCFQENKISNFNFIEYEQNDDCVYKIKCDKGHEYLLIQQAQRFELKFDMACISYKNEDYSAAVMHAASAVERFHEFFVEVLWFNNKDYTVASKTYEDYWKMVKNLSERQLGTFYAFYFNEFKQFSDKLSNNDIKFRNEVIHKGRFATKEKSHAYLEKVYAYIYDILQKISIKKFKDGKSKAIQYNLEYLKNKYSRDTNTEIISATSVENHIISSIYEPDLLSPKNFDEKMEEYFNFQKLILNNK